MKKQVNNFKVASKMIKILKKGSLKVKIDGKKEKKSLLPFEEAAMNAGPVISRMENLPDKADIIVPGSDNDVKKLSINHWHIPQGRVIYNVPEIVVPDTPTFVHTVTKKKVDKVFDFLSMDMLGDLLRCSILGAVYPKLKAKWELLFGEDDDLGETNVLYIPNITVFMDSNGRPLKHPYPVNLLLLAVPSKQDYVEAAGEEVLTEPKIAARIIRNITEFAIKLHCKYLVINPFPRAYKLFYVDEHQTAQIWKNVLEEDKPSKQISAIDFCIDDEESFVIFKRILNGDKSTGETMTEVLEEQTDPMLL